MFSYFFVDLSLIGCCQHPHPPNPDRTYPRNKSHRSCVKPADLGVFKNHAAKLSYIAHTV